MQISRQLSDMMERDTDEKVMVFTDNRALQELCAQINRLLADRREIKADYRKKEISMKEISEMNTAYIELSVADTKAAAYVLEDQLELKQFKIMDEQTIRIYDTSVSTNDLSQTLAKNKVGINAIGKKAESLEDYFLKLTEGEGETCLN